jgi:hypothetical protein
MSKRKEIPDVMSQLQGLGAPPPPPIEAPIEEEQREEIRPALTRPPAKKRGQARSTKNRTTKSRLVGRATYDIGKDLKEALHDESVDLGVPASQFAKYLLLYAWDFYLKGDIPAPATSRSDSPRFAKTIDFD